VASNRPTNGEIISNREFILSSGWHIQNWAIFVALSLISVGIPFSMWKSAASGRAIAQTEEVSEASKKTQSNNSKKSKR
jgi:hypothetical protein